MLVDSKDWDKINVLLGSILSLYLSIRVCFRLHGGLTPCLKVTIRWYCNAAILFACEKPCQNFAVLFLAAHFGVLAPLTGVGSRGAPGAGAPLVAEELTG